MSLHKLAVALLLFTRNGESTTYDENCLLRGVVGALGEAGGAEVMAFDSVNTLYKNLEQASVDVWVNHTITSRRPERPETIAPFLEQRWLPGNEVTVLGGQLNLVTWAKGLALVHHSITTPRFFSIVSNLKQNWGTLSFTVPNRTVQWGRGSICGDSDRIALVRRLLDSPALVRLFVTQWSCISHPKITFIPVGVGPAEKAAALWRVMDRAMTQSPARSRKLVINNSGWKHRAAINALVGSKFNPPVLNEYSQFATQELAYESFLTSKFVLSPPGLGYDCHRTWEVLYLGGIPVMERSGGDWDSLFADLPVVFVDSFDEITPQLLEERYAEIMNSCDIFHFEKLRYSHWSRLFNRHRRRPRHTGTDQRAANS